MSSTVVERIKSRLGVVEIVGTYVKLEKAGSNFKARCPFHNEKTPSFFVSPSRDSYHCFGCNRGGDIFSFIEEIEGLTFPEALHVLASRAGVEVPAYKKGEESEKEKIFRILEDATAYYTENLKNTKDAQEYLKSRGLSGKTAHKFRLGYAYPGWDGLRRHLENKKHNMREAEKAGLLIPKQRGNKEEYYDRFRGRVIFPIQDHFGRVVGFSGRLFPEISKEAKYINSPQTPVYDKSSVVYGLDMAKDEVRKKGLVILVEGQMDVLMNHQAGFINAVGASGTALTDRHIGRLSRLADKIVLAFDQDEAGHGAMLRAAGLSLKSGFEVRIINYKGDKDPADLIKKNESEWRTGIEKAIPVVEHVLRNALDEENKSITRKRVTNELLPLVRNIVNKIEQAQTVKTISEALEVPESAVYEELRKVRQDIGESKEKEDEPQVLSETRQELILKKIVGFLFWQENDDYKNINTKDAHNRLLNIMGEDAYKNAFDRNDNEKRRLVFEAEVWYKGEGKDANRDLDDLFINLEEEVLKKSLTEAIKLLKNAEVKENEEQIQTELIKCKRITEELETLKLRNKK